MEIVTATQREFFEALCAHADQLDEYAGDWNDYWSDGVLCDPDPLRLFRNAQRGQKLIRKLDPAGEIVTAQEMDSISRNLIYFAEHTFGHSASVGAPEELLVKQLEYRKIGYAIAADSAAGELTDRLARALGEAEFTDHMPFTYRVINPHDQPIQALVHLPIDYWEQTLFDGGNFIVKDESGQEYAAQLDQGLRGEAVCCSVALQAGETKILTLYPGVSPQETVVRPQGNNSFENDFYRLQWDETGVTSLVCKSSGRELLRSGEDRLAAPVYQIFSADGRGLACGANYAARSYPANHITRGKIASIGVIKHGPVFTVLRMEYQIEGCMSYIADMTFCAALPQIAVTVKYVKELVREPEGLYVAFPLQLPDAQWYLSKTNLLFPANQLLAGVCHDYFTVEQGAALIGNGAGITLNTLDTPLIMLDDLKLWRYSDEVKGTGTLYSWLTNNKWETNFKSECSGCHESRYLLQAITPATGAPDCKSILDLRELEPLVIRSEPGSRPL